MARERNARRVILDDLRTMSRWMRWAVGQFDQSGQVYGVDVLRRRTRRPDEYIENQPATLRRFANAAREAANALLIIADKADQRARVIEKGA